MIVKRKVIRGEPHHRAGDGKIMIRGGDGGRYDKHRGEAPRRRKGEVMKKILSMILAVMMALGLTFTAFASEAIRSV